MQGPGSPFGIGDLALILMSAGIAVLLSSDTHYLSKTRPAVPLSPAENSCSPAIAGAVLLSLSIQVPAGRGGRSAQPDCDCRDCCAPSPALQLLTSNVR